MTDTRGGGFLSTKSSWMAATLQCTLHRATAKQPLPPPPPIVLTLAGGGVTERTEEYTEFKEGQASLGETVLSLKCELVPHGSGKGYHKKEVFLAIKEAGLGGHRTLGMAKLDAADMRYLSDDGRGRGSSLRTTLLLGGKNQWAVELTLQTSLPRRSAQSPGRSPTRLDSTTSRSSVAELFRALDADSDGVITKEEFLRGLTAGVTPVGSRAVDGPEPPGPPRLRSSDSAPLPSEPTDSPATLRERSVVHSAQEEIVSAQPMPRWEARVAPRERSEHEVVPAPPEQERAAAARAKPRWEARGAPRERSTVRSEQEAVLVQPEQEETVSAQPKPRWGARLATRERSTQEEAVAAQPTSRWEARIAARERSMVHSTLEETVSARQEPRWGPRVAPRDLSAPPDARAKVAARRVIPQRAVPGGSRSQLQGRLGRSGSALERTWTPSEIDGGTSNRPATNSSRSRASLTSDEFDSVTVAANPSAVGRFERVPLEQDASLLSSAATIVGDTTRSSVDAPDKTVVKSPPKMKMKETAGLERTVQAARSSWALEAVAVGSHSPLQSTPARDAPALQRTPAHDTRSEMDFTRQIAALQAEIRQLKHENQELRFASQESARSGDDGRGGGAAAAELETLRVELDESRSQLTQKDADLKHAKSQASAKEKQVTQLRQAMTAAQEAAAEEREVLERQNRQLMSRIESIQADGQLGTKAADPTEVDQLRRENEALVEELLQTKHARSLEMHGEVSRDPEFERLRRENEALVQELAALKQAYERALRNAAKAGGAAAQAAAEHAREMSDLKQQADSRESVAQQTIEELRAQLEAALARVSGLEQGAQQSSSQLAAAQDAHTKTTAQLQESMTKVAELEELFQQKAQVVAAQAKFGKVLEHMGATAGKTRARNVLRTALNGWRVAAHVGLRERRAAEYSQHLASAADKLKIDKVELVRRLVVGRDKYRNLRTVFFLWNKVHHNQLSLEAQESVRIAAADAAVAVVEEHASEHVPVADMEAEKLLRSQAEARAGKSGEMLDNLASYLLRKREQARLVRVMLKVHILPNSRYPARTHSHSLIAYRMCGAVDR